MFTTTEFKITGIRQPLVFNRRLKLTARRVYNRLIKLKGGPRELALGFSLGLMIGMTPFFGVHFVSCIFLASFLGWSKISAIVGVNITNVFTAPLIYPLNYWVGANLVGFSNGVQWPDSFGYADLTGLVWQSQLILVDLCVGGVILGVPLAIAGYFIVFKLVLIYRRHPDACASHQCPR